MLKFLKNKTVIVVCLLFASLLFPTSTFASNSISLSVSSNSVILNLLPKTSEGTFAKSDNLNISVSMSGIGGYTLGIKSNTSGANSTKLINSDDNSKYFSSITSAISESDFSNSSNTSYNDKWGYNPSKYHSSDNTSFQPAPDENGDILDLNNANNASGNYTISIGARANTSTAVGQYVGTVVITAVANITCNPNATTISEAFCMQDMNDSVVNSMEMGTQYQLIDNRDGKQYYIAKMKDGRVWMTQNLDLDLETTPINVAALNSENTDINTFGSHNYTAENGYSCSNPNTTTNCTAQGEVITWTPLNASRSGDWASSNYAPQSSDVGETYYYANDDGSTTRFYSTTACEAQHNDGTCPHYHAGNYYNWTASVASNYTNNITTLTVMENSVCPAGWKLPYGQMSDDPNDEKYIAEAAYSWYAEGIIESRHESGIGDDFTENGWINMRKAPIYMVASGNLYFTDVRDGQSVYMNGNASRSSSTAFIVRVYRGNYANFTGNVASSRLAGGTIRCVARQNNTGSTIITFDKNATDATGTMANQSINSNTIKALVSNNYSRSGYTFDSWNTKEDGSGDSYNDAAEYYAITGSATNAVTLYAQWRKVYTITFNIGSNATSISFDGNTYTNGQSIQVIDGYSYKIGGNFPAGYGFNSWSATNGTIESASTPATNYTVSGNATITLTGKQAVINMTTLTNTGTPSNNCKNEPVTPQLVYDPRDSEAYWVAQLCDGKIWMLDNLRLDLTNQTIINSLDSSNTNASDTILNYLKNGGGTTTDQFPINGLSGSQWTGSYSFSMPMVRSDYKDDITPTTYGVGSGKEGVYYNYCAASAGSYCWGSGTNSTNSPTTDPNSSSLRDIDGDICPKGWHLPTSSNSNDSDYGALYAAYSGADQGQVDALVETFGMDLAGSLYSGSHSQLNYSAEYLSSTWSGKDTMRAISYGTNQVPRLSPGVSAYRNYGFSVRCVLNSN